MGTSSAEDTAEFEPPEQAVTTDMWTAAAPASVDVSGRSHVGRVRSNNEDHFLVGRFGRSLDVLQTSLPEGRVPRRAEEAGFAMVVADGLGGGAAGEVASELAISTFVRLALQVPDWILRLDQPSQAEEVMRRTAERYDQVNAALGDEAKRDPNLRGFATTMTVAVSLGKDLLVAHVGDSRLYLSRAGRLHRLTRDHTLAQARAESGLLAQEEVAGHRSKHVLLKVLGDKRAGAEPDLVKYSLDDGDALLLCTDGLTEMVAEGRIGELLASGASADVVCHQLVEEALAAGGRDNVTVIVARYRFGPTAQSK